MRQEKVWVLLKLGFYYMRIGVIPPWLTSIMNGGEHSSGTLPNLDIYLGLWSSHRSLDSPIILKHDFQLFKIWLHQHIPREKNSSTLILFLLSLIFSLQDGQISVNLIASQDIPCGGAWFAPPVPYWYPVMCDATLFVNLVVGAGLTFKRRSSVQIIVNLCVMKPHFTIGYHFKSPASVCPAVASKQRPRSTAMLKGR